MRGYGLGFISDANLFSHVKETVQKYRTAISLSEFNRNVVDPIKLTFDAKVYRKDYREMVESECIRQIDKSNTNLIGTFHQRMFNHIGEGWAVPKKGFDVVNRERHIFAELKNKHNTMNSASSQRTYMKMQNWILSNDKATCYLVEVIAKKSQNIPWAVKVDGNSFLHDKIRRISIDRFYEIITGNADSFRNLCQTLPVVLDDVMEDIGACGIRNTVFDELDETSPDIFRSLFLSAFGGYLSFDDF